MFLFFLGRIVEQHGEFDAAMSELREEGRGRIAWIQIRSCVIRREEDQGAQKSQDSLPIFILEGSKGVTRGLGLATVPENNLVQIGATPIMAESDLAAHTPERSCEEFLLDGAVTPIPC